MKIKMLESFISARPEIKQIEMANMKQEELPWYINAGLQGFHRPVKFDSKNLHHMGTQHWQGTLPKHKNPDPPITVECFKDQKAINNSNVKH